MLKETVKTSVVELMHEFIGIMLITHHEDREEAVNKFFNEDRTAVSDDERWNNLTPDQRGLVIQTTEETMKKLSDYFDEINSVHKLRLVKE